MTAAAALSPPSLISRDHVMPLLRDNLHWQCTGADFVGLALSYTTDLCLPITSIWPRSAFRSAAHVILFVLQTHLELGKIHCRKHSCMEQPAWWCSEHANTWRV